jgi:DNA ligase-1
VKLFSQLLDSLVFAPQRNAKLRHLEAYLRAAPDPDRGYVLALFAGALAFKHAKPAMIRDIVTSRVDPTLFALSYDYVGDLAETTALIWPKGDVEGGAAQSPPSIATVVETLRDAKKGDLPSLFEQWLDCLDASGRYALLKLITGGLRVGVSARLMKTSLARFGGCAVEEIEEIWHALQPPYLDLFAWLEGRGPKPDIGKALVFRPLMLASPLDSADLEKYSADDFMAEWKWDGIRVQIAADGEGARVFSRTGDDIGASFPEIVEAAKFHAIVDGELLVVRDGVVAPFNDLQQRLGRKTVSRASLAKFPAHVRLYDILSTDGDDLRPLPLTERRHRLETWFETVRPERMDVSPLVDFSSWSHLADVRAGARSAGIEGLMLKRVDSAYVAGRPKGPWFKWKRDPLTADCVLMYAQRGHGKRSSYYSDFTFGCWRTNGSGEGDLVPVGKAYFGFTDAELVQLDKWVRGHTVERYGPVRLVEPGLVFEVAFDAVHPSARHKSGVAMRFPRIHRIRWDKPAAEADHVDAVKSLIEQTDRSASLSQI